MSSVVLAALLGWLIALAIFFGFLVLLRYIEHRERMALIARGLDPRRMRWRRQKVTETGTFRGMRRTSALSGRLAVFISLGRLRRG